MHNYDKNACHDYNTVERRMRRAATSGDTFWGGMTRRQFMSRSAAATGAAAFASSLPMWFPECTFAENGACADHTFIFIHLFGGPDGLAMVCPIGDADYIGPGGIREPGSLLGVPVPGTGTPEDLVDLNDGYWALSGGLADLLDIWNAGKLAIATGCTLPGQSYSHFTAERWVGQATPNPMVGLEGSMMARHLETGTPYGGPIRGMSVGANLHDHLLGGAPFQALPVNNAESFGIQGLSGGVDQGLWLDAMVEMYGNQNKLPAWQDLSVVTRDAINLLDTINYSSAANYDTSYLGNGLRRVAALLKAGIGLETVTLRTGGWDTHNNQGSNSTTGAMWLLMESLARNLKAFFEDMTTTPNGSDKCWTIYMTGEFGREAEPNLTAGGNPVTPETAGTDHGYATNVYMMGTNICGGQVINAGLWPGVGTLHNPGATTCGGTNDVCLGTDPRIFLVEIFDRLMCNQANLSYLFPGLTIPSPANYMGVVC